MAQKPFYVVLRRSDEKLYRHETKESADEEAIRLAKQCGDAFFVLPVITGYKRYIVKHNDGCKTLLYKSVKLNENLAKKIIRKIINFLFNLMERV